MAFAYADRVQETSNTTGTGPYDLAGVVLGFQTFVAGIGDTNTCYYCATNGTDWEVGYGTVTDAAPDTLSRTTIFASSNAGAAVSWPAGTKTIFCTIPAAFARTRPRRTVKTSGTSYVPPAGCHTIEVEVQGGGAGGGLCTSTGPISATGGGAGGYARKLYTVIPGTSYTYAVGAGGVSSGDGGNSTFTDGITLITGSGGIQGSDNRTSPASVSFIGGTGTNGDINISGGTGYNWVSNSLAGNGGDSVLGRGGIAAGIDNDGGAGSGFGGGGAGACAASTTDRAGGAGAPGCVIITEYY